MVFYFFDYIFGIFLWKIHFCLKIYNKYFKHFFVEKFFKFSCIGELPLNIQVSFLDLSGRKFVSSLLFGNIFVVSV